MKTTLIFLLLVFGTSFTARAQFVNADIGVNGLTCSMCSRGVAATLQSLPFIDSVSTDLNALVTHVTFKKGSKVSIDDLRKMVEDAGFSVRFVHATFQFDDQKIDKDYHFSYGGDTYVFVGVQDKTISGPVELQFVDKAYVSKQEYAVLSKTVNFGEHSATGTLYHVTL
ncbi:MAG TPA: heavy-metal-associated domain-containing protein [Candidatus Kapabacteria bacterium]